MRYKPSIFNILISIVLILMYITYHASFSRNFDFFLFVIPPALIIALFDEIGYFNKKIVLTILVVVLVIAWGLILYQPFSPSVKIQDYGIYVLLTVLLTILLISLVLWVFWRWNKIEKAVEPYDKVIEANPNDVTSLNNKEVELANLKRYNWAMECFDKILELNPDDSAALHNKGVVITKLEKTRNTTEIANEYFDQALKLDPGFKNAKSSSKIILEN